LDFSFDVALPRKLENSRVADRRLGGSGFSVSVLVLLPPEHAAVSNETRARSRDSFSRSSSMSATEVKNCCAIQSSMVMTIEKFQKSFEEREAARGSAT